MKRNLSICYPRISQAIVRFAAVAALLAVAPTTFALEELDEGRLGDVTGEGLALVLNDISLRAGPTTYIELTGTDEASGTALQWRRGDLRWYGYSLTGDQPLTTWSGSCAAGILNMGCPIGGTITNLAPHDNPVVLRAFDYLGTTMDGSLSQSRTVFEMLYPSKHEAFRVAFWGEMNVGSGSTSSGTAAATNLGSVLGDGTNKLQVQNIWSKINASGAVLRLFETSDADPGKDPGLTQDSGTLGIQYINQFSANIRMSVAQTLMSPDTLGQTPEFDTTEGLYIGDYRVFMPIGQLHYQQLVIDEGATGNLSIRLTQLPAVVTVYDEHYGRNITTDPTGGYDRSKTNNANYAKSHAFVRMGDFAPDQNFTAAYQGTSATGLVDNNGNICTRSDPTSDCTGSYKYDSGSNYNKQDVNACIADRTGCSNGGVNGINGRYDTSDGVFFVAAPGSSFTVFNKSPNYMSDRSVDADLNLNIPGAASPGGTYNGWDTTNTVTTTGGFGGTQALSRINLGDTNIQGFMIHSMSLTTLGAK